MLGSYQLMEVEIYSNKEGDIKYCLVIYLTITNSPVSLLLDNNMDLIVSTLKDLDQQKQNLNEHIIT
jgi:hypothetical protein